MSIRGLPVKKAERSAAVAATPTVTVTVTTATVTSAAATVSVVPSIAGPVPVPAVGPFRTVRARMVATGSPDIATGHAGYRNRSCGRNALIGRKDEPRTCDDDAYTQGQNCQVPHRTPSV